jgi:ribosomal protein S27E
MVEKLIPKPMSRFLRVKCKCGSEHKVFSSPAIQVHCLKCKEILVLPSAGRGTILGKIVKEY